MRKLELILTLCVVLVTQPSLADECPRTLGSDRVFSEPSPQAETWYGSDSLAVVLPADGIWPTTAPNALIAVKLFWWNAGFEPGMETEMTTGITRIDDGENDAVISSATNAYAVSLGGWTMLTGIDFPSEGCWRVTGRYRGQELNFVVETRIHRDAASATATSESNDR
ncbi:MAG: hypothetical protein AAFX44_06435 [Pseudomonadota bacterium]